MMDLGDRVLRSALRAETVRARLEVRLEDRLEHQLQRSLHDPVGVVGIPNARTLPPVLGIVFSRTRCGTNRPALRSSRSPSSSLAAPKLTDRGAIPSTPAV